MNIYLLTSASAKDIHNKTLAGYDIAMQRLNRAIWPLYSRTAHKNNIKNGDVCLIYIAGLGKFSQHFTAMTHVDKVEDWVLRKGHIDDSNLLTDTPTAAIMFNQVKIFDEPVDVRPLLGKLNLFPKNLSNWGAVIQGGCRRINLHDYEVITGKCAQKIKL